VFYKLYTWYWASKQKLTYIYYIKYTYRIGLFKQFDLNKVYEGI